MYIQCIIIYTLEILFFFINLTFFVVPSKILSKVHQIWQFFYTIRMPHLMMPCMQMKTVSYSMSRTRGGH